MLNRRINEVLKLSYYSLGCLFVVEGAVTGFMTHICKHTTYLCTNRQQCLYILSIHFMSRLARQRVKNCGLSDQITVICTEIARDQYMSQLVDFLSYYEARFDTVFSLIPSGDGLIQYVCERLLTKG